MTQVEGKGLALAAPRCSDLCSDLDAARRRRVLVWAGRSCGAVGWPAGLEPVTYGATIRSGPDTHPLPLSRDDFHRWRERKRRNVNRPDYVVRVGASLSARRLTRPRERLGDPLGQHDLSCGTGRFKSFHPAQPRSACATCGHDRSAGATTDRMLSSRTACRRTGRRPRRSSPTHAPARPGGRRPWS